ncbi:glycoside hydrolase family 5 protein [Amanita muscaria Koide BX008]|uniref:mannan endo-1,4-beta-mannosidase n=1 Tax=Amanita muscaria (strain Koide BX008) TaxID=946122 RepID=A0A0C2XKX9_AMAMK|nr:glycoside hydrolase family 5 protein [Amanita muscaria Koide BX008]
MRCFPALLASLVVLQVASAERLSKRHNTNPFVTTSSNGRFLFNGTEFPLIGTTAYWLPTLASPDDIDFTLGNISQAGFNAVRIWAFNDVPTIPENGTWFQHINSNGTLTINNGTNGLQKLDTVVQLAEKHRLFLILSLTNNWNPLPNDSIVNYPINFTTRDTTNSTNTTTLPRNFLSNQYGGMDVYVRQLTHSQEHDQFYLNASLVNAFKNYTTQIASRYKNSPYVLAWEVANDPRCNSSLSASNTCNTTTVTFWHSDVAQHVQQVDPNHLVSSGSSGFLCADCPKLFQNKTSPPQPSASPIARRRFTKPLTKKALLQERKEILKKRRAAAIAKRTPADGIRVRGRWVATPTRRQAEESGIGSAFNGVTGVDSEDILSIPQIGFGSYQLFPDQFNYGLVEPNGPHTFNESLAVGLDWISRQAQASARTGKPIVNTGFGLVTQNNSQVFVPFNSTIAPFGPTSTAQQQPFGVTDTQRDQAYLQWIQASLSSGLAGIIHYQWGQSGLTPQAGTPITPVTTSTPITPAQNQTGVTPNDGYSVQGAGEASFAQVIQQAVQAFGKPPS